MITIFWIWSPALKVIKVNNTLLFDVFIKILPSRNLARYEPAIVGWPWSKFVKKDDYFFRPSIFSFSFLASPFPSHKFIDEPLPNPLLVECKPRQSVMFVQALNENPLNIRNTFFHRRRCHLCRLRRRRHRRCCRRYYCCHHPPRCCSGGWFHHRLFPKSTHLP